MYTVDDKKNYEDEFDEEEEYEGTFWQRNKGIIIKFLIIIACVIILILLIKALKRGNTVVYNEDVHNANVRDVRLAAEDYFFVKKNLPKQDEIKEVTISKLQDNGLIKDVVDANSKVCDANKSVASLKEEKNLYALRIKLNCSIEEKEEVFYYSIVTGTCLNCNGKTLMNGKESIKEEEKKDDENNNNTIDYGKYSCSTWSDWTDEDINDSLLIKKTRILVKGVKKGGITSKIEYGTWSDWTETPITETGSIEVEKKSSNEQRWSENKTSTTNITNNSNVRLIQTQSVGGGTTSYCPSGYKKSGSKCVSTKLYKGNLTYQQYNSSAYQVTNKPCERVDTEKDKNGNYIWVYKSCQYRKVTSMKKRASSSYTLYTYQELETIPVTYYRYRTKNVINTLEEDIYTQDYYEENKLPQGYQKLAGSEITQYAYKISACEK